MPTTTPATTVRPVRPDDAPELERFYAELSADSRLLRFLGVVTGLSHRQSATFCTPDHAHREGFVVTAPAPGSGAERIVGHLCLEPDGKGSAEVAIAIADARQRRGLGRRLVARGVEWARGHGISRLTATMWADNAGIHRLLLGLGLPARARPLSGGLSAVTIDLSPPAAAAA
jgi:GNAT superfamily N-acetyltransferase